MGFIKRFFHSMIYKHYDEFAETPGYKNWKDAEKNTFFIHHLEGDIGWSATELPSGQWAIWKDEGQPPYPYKILPAWEKAISCLREQFEKSELPDSHWMPEGFDENENIFSTKPNRDKKL